MPLVCASLVCILADYIRFVCISSYCIRLVCISAVFTSAVCLSADCISTDYMSAVCISFVYIISAFETPNWFTRKRLFIHFTLTSLSLPIAVLPTLNRIKANRNESEPIAANQRAIRGQSEANQRPVRDQSTTHRPPRFSSPKRIN